MANYFVSTSGNDSNAGTSPNAPWQTFAKVLSESFNPGDSILLGSDNLWRERLVIPSSGVSSYPIRFGKYGSGADPVINGADIITTWADEGGNVWSATLTTEPNLVYFDGNRGTPESAQVDVDAEYDWFWNANTLYVYSTSDPDTAYTDPGIEASARDCIAMNGRSYLIFENIECRYGHRAGIRTIGEDSYNIVDGCTFYGCWNGIDHNPGAGTLLWADNWAVRNCTTRYTEYVGIAPRRYSRNWTIENNDGRYDAQTRDNVWDGASIKTGRDNSYGHIIQNNLCRDAYGQGIWVDQASSGPSIIRYNRCENNGSGYPYGHGILIEKSSDCEVYYNVCIGNVTNIALSGIDGEPCSNTEVYNNTCSGGEIGIRVRGETTDSTTNNLIKNNIFIGANRWQLFGRLGGQNDGVSGYGNIYEYNCLGLEATEFIQWGDGVYYDTYGAWETAYGGSTYSVEADPLFTDPDNDDFTLQTNSPCKDRGTDVDLTRDYVGTTVPQSSALDIGAYERYNPESPQRGSSITGRAGARRGPRRYPTLASILKRVRMR